jgi:hypothetical protein
LRDTVEILRCVDRDFAVLIVNFVNDVASGDWVGCACAVELRAFEQMELPQFAADFDVLSECGLIGRIRYAWNGSKGLREMYGLFEREANDGRLY